jgi:hypothetical protein
LMRGRRRSGVGGVVWGRYVLLCEAYAYAQGYMDF